MNINKKDLKGLIESIDPRRENTSFKTLLKNIDFKIDNHQAVLTVTNNELAVRCKSDSFNPFDDPDRKIFNVNTSILSLVLKVVKKIELSFEAEGENEKPMFVPEKKEGDFLFNLDKDEVGKLKGITYSVSVDTIKPVFNAFHIYSEKGKIKACTTDSRRLSIVEIGETDQEFDLLMPLETMKTTFNICKDAKLSFYKNKENVFISIGDGDIEIISRVVEGLFPNVNHVIPKNCAIERTLNRESLIKTLMNALTFTKEPSNKIMMTFKDKLLIEDMERKSEIEFLDRRTNANEILLGINCRFVIEALQSCTAETVIIGVTGAMIPIIISDRDHTAIITSIPIKSED